jgi:hypothetical protein
VTFGLVGDPLLCNKVGSRWLIGPICFVFTFCLRVWGKGQGFDSQGWRFGFGVWLSWLRLNVLVLWGRGEEKDKMLEEDDLIAIGLGIYRDGVEVRLGSGKDKGSRGSCCMLNKELSLLEAFASKQTQ